MILDVEVALVGSIEVLRTMIEDRHVCIPFDIGYFGILRHEVVNDAETEVLHLRIGHVENELCTAASQHCITLRSLDDPVGMLLVEFRNAVGHLRLNPDAELDTMLLGIAEQSFDAFGQLVLIYHPVAQ